MKCPYCDADAERHRPTWYFDCENGHTFHVDDWSDELDAGVKL